MKDTVEDISTGIDISVFVIVLIVQTYVAVLRRFKIDKAALITMLFYLLVLFFRLLRSFIKQPRTHPL